MFSMSYLVAVRTFLTLYLEIHNINQYTLCCMSCCPHAFSVTAVKSSSYRIQKHITCGITWDTTIHNNMSDAIVLYNTMMHSTIIIPSDNISTLVSLFLRTLCDNDFWIAHILPHWRALPWQTICSGNRIAKVLLYHEGSCQYGNIYM